MIPSGATTAALSDAKVVVSALLGVSAALSWGNPIATPYAAGWNSWNGAAWDGAAWNGAAWNGAAWNGAPLTRAAALPYAAPWSGIGLAQPYAAGIGLARPLTYAAAAPAVTSSQYQAQDELGQYQYGYSGPLSSKTETMNALGATAGSYSYLDANGIKQTVNYVADAAGFRVKATNLPVAPELRLAAPVHTLVGPAPVDDTAEVKAAKAEFRMLYNEAAAAAEAAPDARRRRRSMEPMMPEDTAEVKAAKAVHAQLYNAEVLRNSGVPVATPVLLDTPAVMAEKARHAALYNQAALRAAAAPDYGPVAYAGYGLGLRSGLFY
ncbi:Cuticle protein 6 [Amphibalanus amphitrite]|uniref:Cuticle protein 6 n=1 Tax=Amphibalanus amphitrite TaxID=1232801 RepID=A0A6A4V418_AMPAM|nr:Cuticle protein 6 [Amphibalanus amphitrite]